jgi:hypothetical protein
MSGEAVPDRAAPGGEPSAAREMCCRGCGHTASAHDHTGCCLCACGYVLRATPAEPGASPPAGEDGCNVRPDGECVSGTPCIHSPSVAQALQRAHEEYFDTDDGTPAVPTPYWQFLAGAALRATPAEPGARPPTFDGPDVGIEAVARGLDALADEDIHGGATYETCRAGARFLRAQAECIAAWHRWEKSAARSPSPPHALVEKWAALATSGDGRHPEAAETLSRCASELKGALAARSPAPAGDGPTCGKCKQRVEGDGYCPDCHIWTEGYGPAGDAALERWVETGIYEPTPDAPREDALRDDEGDPTTAEAGEWVVDCVRDGEFTVSNGLRTYRTEYLGNAERLASWLRQAALRGAVSRLRGLTRGQHEP